MSSATENILLITAGYDRTIRFWQASTAAIYRTIMHEDSVSNENEISYEKLFFLANELSSNTSTKNFISCWKLSAYKNV
jgi:WD40 repeat protein